MRVQHRPSSCEIVRAPAATRARQSRCSVRRRGRRRSNDRGFARLTGSPDRPKRVRRNTCRGRLREGREARRTYSARLHRQRNREDAQSGVVGKQHRGEGDHQSRDGYRESEHRAPQTEYLLQRDTPKVTRPRRERRFPRPRERVPETRSLLARHGEGGLQHFPRRTALRPVWDRAVTSQTGQRLRTKSPSTPSGPCSARRTFSVGGCPLEPTCPRPGEIRVRLASLGMRIDPPTRTAGRVPPRICR